MAKSTLRTLSARISLSLGPASAASVKTAASRGGVRVALERDQLRGVVEPQLPLALGLRGHPLPGERRRAGVRPERAADDPADMVDRARIAPSRNELGSDRGQVLGGECVEQSLSPRLIASPGPLAESGGDPPVLGDRRRAQLSLSLAVADEVLEPRWSVRRSSGSAAACSSRNRWAAASAWALVKNCRRRPAGLQPRLGERLARVLAAGSR